MYELNLQEVRELAEKYAWIELDFQQKIYMVSFGKQGMRINIYLTKGTVATCLEHPIQGKTQLFRRHCNMYFLEKIFIYPRVHTSYNDGIHGYKLRKHR